MFSPGRTTCVKALGWLKKERKKKKRKMTKLNFHHFQFRHSNNVYYQSWCHCRVGATPVMRSNCLQTYRIHHQVNYGRFNANTCIVAAILFSGHPYIGEALLCHPNTTCNNNTCVRVLKKCTTHCHTNVTSKTPSPCLSQSM